ncbi:Lrp/AsnC family transcriptional regulator [Sphingomonas sp. S1-29]|uniref:Lrp/AsnC family transcriptional regulator n=1 Tax=Sphingomonas sp. S1-29 TaxID=2991074 RepID=UPI00223EDAB0|nr:Lrp/AsnC family transcriptional regulator [Sphingomonas sp. S1-29]UZK68845.1 Lrp/AsnC family transcriptional regulator [Sphingomonas sp. S1-29]
MTTDRSLDRIDRKILRELQGEGRLSNAALALRVSLSQSACLSRVRRLEEAGVIQSYHARLNPFHIEVGLVLIVEVTLAGRHPEERMRFEEAMLRLPQVVEASHVSGDTDYILKVVVGAMPEWNALKDLMVQEVGATRIITHVIMDTPKAFKGYPIGGS